MLSLFPQILFLAPFSATLIRIAVAILFAYIAWSHFSRTDTVSRASGLVLLTLATSLFVGVWVQLSACIASVMIAVALVKPSLTTFPRSTLALALIMSLSLIVTGAGVFAFDLPL